MARKRVTKYSLEHQNLDPELSHTSNGKKETVAWDDDVSGLGLRTRAGRSTWILQTRVGGKSRKRTLGACHEISKTNARNLARDLLAKSAQSDLVASVSPRLSELAERTLADFAMTWKPSTLVANRRAFKNVILPVLGNLRLERIGAKDVRAWREALTGSPGSINRYLAV